jgi:endonuclease/exonuclease/phosphatase family metal-dependent hydrolase
MIIATLNIDWAKKGKLKIENYLNQFDFDFLVLTEAIDLDLKNYKFKYFSEEIPTDIIFEKQDYSKILKGEKGYRTIIYSKIPFSKKHIVCDNKTSLALEFENEFGNLVIYASIIGTLFRQKPFAEIELKNCIKDCAQIFKTNKNIILIGDLNTSFIENEKQFSINSETTDALKDLTEKLNLINVTSNIKENIDHIIIPKTLENIFIENKIFVEKGVLSDHQGICIYLN